jgi:hypothetical protein
MEQWQDESLLRADVRCLQRAFSAPSGQVLDDSTESFFGERIHHHDCGPESDEER